MAWSTPRTWVTGELVTAALLNSYVRDNQNALHDGASDIASLAANDIVVASSSSQLTRQASLNVAQGGTGATSLTDGGLLLGSGTSAITALGVASNGQIPIGDGSTDPQLANITGTSNEIEITNGSASIQVGIVTNPTLAGANFSAIPAGSLSSGTVATARLGSGTASTGTFLRGDSSWTAAGGGKVLQVVAATYATAETTADSAYTDTGLTADITCESTDSKVAVFMAVGGCQKDTANTKVRVKALRDSTQIGIEPNACYNGSTSAISVGVGAVFNILDSPSSTSALTYKAQFSSQSGGNAYTQVNGATSSLILVELDFS